MKRKYNKISLILFILLTIIFSSCKKFVTVDTPITLTGTNDAYKTDLNAASIVTGIYAQMANDYINRYNAGGTSFYTELSADNLVIIPGVRADFDVWYQNALEPTYSATGNAYWSSIYSLMYTINTSIENLTNNQDLTPEVSKRLLGEAYFLRAFSYFYLVNLYGEVPLVLTSQYKSNSRIAKSNTTEVYNQIVLDLDKSAGLLDNTYVAANVTTVTDKRLRPNLPTVNALQARVFLYKKDYAAAEAAATKVISESSLYSFTDLASTFISSSSEAIWDLQPVNLGFNTFEAQWFTLTEQGLDFEHPAYLSDSFMVTFEPGDDRKNKWVGIREVRDDNGNVIATYPYPSKYKQTFVDGSTNFVEMPIVLRLAEQYLIRAEARNEQGNTGGAVDDLNALRKHRRAAVTDDIPNPLPDLSASLSKDQLKPIILHERRVELFTEWGHRWFDLKRSGTMDAVMTEAEKYKGGTWAPYKSLYPIPSTEILLNNLLKQNPGYTD
jgi:acyl-CoA thioesterase FadM